MFRVVTVVHVPIVYTHDVLATNIEAACRQALTATADPGAPRSWRCDLGSTPAVAGAYEIAERSVPVQCEIPEQMRSELWEA